VTGPKSLDELFAAEDEHGLLDVKPAAAGAPSETARIRQQFEEISSFVDRVGFPPGEGPEGHRPGLSERALQARLKACRATPSLLEDLAAHDRHGLLAAQIDAAPDPTTLDELLALDDELLDSPGSEIFTFKHARPLSAQPDKISERKACTDFADFKPLFDACFEDLKARRRKSMPFANEQEIAAGEFFILNGVTVYVAAVNDPHMRNGKRNARLRLIFENGTEGENLLRSLATELYKDPFGRRISDPDAGPLFEVSEPEVANTLEPGRLTGCIYVVRSLSTDPEIARLGDSLFKIGFTTGSFEDRIRGAKDDPTFLLAPVHPVRTYTSVDLNPTRLENLLHRLFGAARLDLELMDRFGKPFRPREWFLLPLPVIEEAIRRVLDGSVVHYAYDPRKAALVKID
jgi:hypothetical protein